MWPFGRLGFFGRSNDQIVTPSSIDLTTWEQGTGVELDGFGHAAKDETVLNNNVHTGRGGKES